MCGVSKHYMDNMYRIICQTRVTCHSCNEKIYSDTDNISCVECKQTFHLACAGIVNDLLIKFFKIKKEDWKCLECSSQRYENLTDNNELEISGCLNSLNKTITEFQTSWQDVMHSTKYQQQKTRSPTASSSLEYSEILDKSAKSSFNSVTSDVSQSHCDTFDKTLNSLEEKVDYLLTIQRRNNLVIQGVPKLANETETKLKNVIGKIAESCNVSLDLSSLVSVYRLGSSTNSTFNSGCEAILVRFTENSLQLKELLLSKYFHLLATNTPLNCRMIGINSSSRIFINHHLSKKLLNVKDQAMILKKAKIVSKVTPRYNSVKVSVNNRSYKINSTHDLKELIWQTTKLNIDNITNNSTNFSKSSNVLNIRAWRPLS